MDISLTIYLLFGLVIFFILDLIALVFDIFVITGPLGFFINFLSTLAYILYTFLVYGKIGATSRLFDFKKNFKQKAFKKLGKKGFKLIGGSTIPFVNVWAVWDDYKEAKRELDEKKATIRSEVEEQELKNKIKQKEVEEYQKEDQEDTKENQEYPSQDRGEFEDVNPWISRDKSDKSIDIKPKNKSKTIQEEVSGIKTGMNREDYDEGIIDYSKKETYDKLVLENEEKKKNELRERQDIEATRSAKKKQEETEKKNAYDQDFIRRFGVDTYTRMNRDRESRNPKKESEDIDQYREAA